MYLIHDEEIIRRAEALSLELQTMRTKVEFDFHKEEILRHLVIAQEEVNLIIDSVKERSRTSQ